jgi:lipopolysaccharide biosynthesis regulator YciM
VWQELWPWLIGALVVILGGLALWQVVRRPRPRHASPDDLHATALRHWLDGRLEAARDHLRDLVRQRPAAAEAYLQLGTLYRLTGDPGRAAAIHRSLAVRPQLPQGRRVAVGLELAADLVDLERWSEAAEVLGQLADAARDEVRWYRLRFAAAEGLDDVETALRVLRAGEKATRDEDAAALRALRAAWLTDRALQLARAGDAGGARKILASTRGLAEAAGRTHLVEALVAMAEKDPDRAVRAVEGGLAAHPAEMAPALLTLEGVLADAGRFLRVVPILEDACRREDAPPAIWMALARLYEKLDRREDAIRLLAGKRGDPRLTPDAAAPYLRLLTAEVPDAGFTRVWNLLGDPHRHEEFRCGGCGRREPDLRWFCPRCRRPDSFIPAPVEDSRPEHESSRQLSEPPRY